MSVSDLRSDLDALVKVMKQCPPEKLNNLLAEMSYFARESARINLLKLYDIIKVEAWKAEERLAARKAEDEAPEEDNEEDDPWEEIYGPPSRLCLSLNGDATRPKHSGGSTTHLGDFYRTGGGGPESGYWVSKSLFKITHLIRRTWGEDWKIIESYPADRILTKDVDQGYGHTVTYVCLASKLGVK